MILLLDVGNSRVKAGLCAGERLRPLGAADHRGGGIGAALDGLGIPAADRAVAAVTAGPAVATDLAAWAAGRGLELEVIRATAQACGVRCAYPEPSRLGADRWAALVGARGRTREACLVVDAGSAITIDAMDAGGRHLGGFIIPGLALMAASLHRGTGDLAALSAASDSGPSGGFPVDTRPAIEEGALLAAAGLVREARARVPASAAPVILVTGGDAERIAAAVPGTQVVPELVLEGLVLLARGASW